MREATTRASLAFAIILAVFIIGPALLPAPFGPYPLLRWGDVLDLVTPLAVLSAAWLLFSRASAGPQTTAATLAFVALVGLWASAQGMHLAANALGHVIPDGSGDASTLTHDLDEVLSHYLWHAALLGLTALIVWRSLSGPAEAVGRAGDLAAVAAASVVFGFTFFIMVTEGGTGSVGLPGAAVIAVAGIVTSRRTLIHRPAGSMFVAGYLIAMLLAAVWAAMHGWQLVEFSKEGLIE